MEAPRRNRIRGFARLSEGRPLRTSEFGKFIIRRRRVGLSRARQHLVIFSGEALKVLIDALTHDLKRFKFFVVFAAELLTGRVPNEIEILALQSSTPTTLAVGNGMRD